MKKSFIIFLVIVIVLIITSFIFISNGNRVDRLENLYNKISSSENYTFSMEEINSEYNYKMKVSQRKNDINIDMKSGDDYTSTLIVDGQVYVIMHNLQEYYCVNSNDVDGDIIISGLKNASKKEYINGKEEIFGKTYYYEEYNDVTDFFMLLHETEHSKIKTRFYFENDKLIFIKNILVDEEQKQEELLKVTIDYSVENQTFEIPKDYAEL